MVERLREAISRITDWKFELMTKTAEDGTLVGLITVEKELSEKVKKSLSDEHVPELVFPGRFQRPEFFRKGRLCKKEERRGLRAKRPLTAEPSSGSSGMIQRYSSIGRRCSCVGIRVSKD